MSEHRLLVTLLTVLLNSIAFSTSQNLLNSVTSTATTAVESLSQSSLANWPLNTSSGVVFVPSRAPQIGVNWTALCPSICVCDQHPFNTLDDSLDQTQLENSDGESADLVDTSGERTDRKSVVLRRIVCDSGNLTSIPLYQIPPYIQWIELRGSNDAPNKLTLGPVFYRFEKLKILVVSHSLVPAIGPATFQYRLPLEQLDLSHNRIVNLNDANFKGLTRLERLDLSHNNISDLTSARFRSLPALRWLNLSHNALQTITTRLFYNLTRLHTLDLSWNPIVELPPQSTLDLRTLRRLVMSNCHVRQLDALFYRNVPRLVYFDLRNNRLETLAKSEFRYLSSLRTLLLDGNRLSTLGPNVFQPVKLDYLGLSNNNITDISESAFGNCSIVQLNLCGNHNLTTIGASVLLPLSVHLKRLELCNLPNLARSAETLGAVLRPLASLEALNIANTNLSVGERLSPEVFTNFRSSLRELNLSQNALVNVSAGWFADMSSLRVLDLSHNSLIELTSDVLYILAAHANLTRLYIDQNPWSCFRCHLLYLRNWIAPNAEQLATSYHTVCKEEGRCARCAFPAHLVGVAVHQMEEWQLEWCTDPTVQLRVSTTEPNVGLVLALLIIIILIIVIVGVIVYYRNRGAIYFTNEDLLYGRASTINANNIHGGNNNTGTGDGAHRITSRSVAQHNFGMPHEEIERGGSIYNVSNRIRYFAEATRQGSEDHTDRSSLDDSLTINSTRLSHSHHPRHKMNGNSVCVNPTTLPRTHRPSQSHHPEMEYATVRRGRRQMSRATSGASSLSSRSRTDLHRSISGPPPPLPRIPPPKNHRNQRHLPHLHHPQSGPQISHRPPIQQRSVDVPRALKERLESVENHTRHVKKKVEPEISDLSDQHSEIDQLSLSDAAFYRKSNKDRDEEVSESGSHLSLRPDGASSAEIDDLNADEEDEEEETRNEPLPDAGTDEDEEEAGTDEDEDPDDDDESEANVTETKRRIDNDSDASEASSNQAFAEGTSSQSSNGE